jgi:hypothetical protein
MLDMLKPKAARTIPILARSLDRHLDEMGMGPSELVELACALIDHAARRARAPKESTALLRAPT